MKNYLQLIFDKIKDKSLRFEIGRFQVTCLWFLYLVLAVSFAPIIFAVLTWVYAFFNKDALEWSVKMIDASLKIVDHVLTTQVVAGIMAYGSALVDSNDNGIPDRWEKLSQEGERPSYYDRREPQNSRTNYHTTKD